MHACFQDFFVFVKIWKRLKVLGKHTTRANFIRCSNVQNREDAAAIAPLSSHTAHVETQLNVISCPSFLAFDLKTANVVKCVMCKPCIKFELDLRVPMTENLARHSRVRNILKTEFDAKSIIYDVHVFSAQANFGSCFGFCHLQLLLLLESSTLQSGVQDNADSNIFIIDDLCRSIKQLSWPSTKWPLNDLLMPSFIIADSLDSYVSIFRSFFPFVVDNNQVAAFRDIQHFVISRK